MTWIASLLLLVGSGPARARSSISETRIDSREQGTRVARTRDAGDLDRQDIWGIDAEPLDLDGAELTLPLERARFDPIEAISIPEPEQKLLGKERERAVRQRTVTAARKAQAVIAAGVERGDSEIALGKIFEGFNAGKLERFRAPVVPKGEIVDLTSIDTDVTAEIKRKKEKRLLKIAAADQRKLKKLQNRFFFDGRFMMLAVKNGMDTSGKDSSINHVLHWMNKQGMFVKSFKEPTAVERAHHFLWRVKRALSQVTKGLMGVFNRSHYEDVVVPFMFPEHFTDLSEADIDKRITQIKAFELEMARQGFVILKFFYHVSREEQKTRLEARRDGPKRKQVKFQKSDVTNRERWDRAMTIWGRILAETNTPWAPWFIVPADNEWFRDYVTGRLWVKRLKALELHYPEPDAALLKTKIPD